MPDHPALRWKVKQIPPNFIIWICTLGAELRMLNKSLGLQSLWTTYPSIPLPLWKSDMWILLPSVFTSHSYLLISNQFSLSFFLSAVRRLPRESVQILHRGSFPILPFTMHLLLSPLQFLRGALKLASFSEDEVASWSAEFALVLCLYSWYKEIPLTLQIPRLSNRISLFSCFKATDEF